MKGFAFRRRLLIPLAVTGLTVGASMGFTSSALAAGSLSGAGSTLVQPLEAAWAAGWQNKTGNTVTYQGVGSGTGITDISQRLVDFGASDAPMTPTQAAGCHSCVQIPWGLTATAVGYNVPGAGKHLHLSGPVLAQIYLGQITNWSSAAIRKLNPGAKLPNLKITPIFRSDGSGDTYAFTNYLSHVSSAFRSRVGFATSVQFPAGVGAKGNSGVTTLVQSTKGGVAYIAASFLIAHGVPAAAVQNSAGHFEFPNLTNIENAAKTVKHVASNNTVSIVDPGRGAKVAYPISTFTYAIVPHGAKQRGLLKSFITYALTTGQHFGAALDFAPIPKVVLNAGKRALKSL